MLMKARTVLGKDIRRLAIPTGLETFGICKNITTLVPNKLCRHYNRTSTKRDIHKLSSSVQNPPGLPLSGLKVLDLSRVLAGPFCTQILADYGAEVLKIEQPGSGDETRLWRTQSESQKWKDEHPLMSLYFCAINRNKRSMTLNLKEERGQRLVMQMVEKEGYDVLVHNFLPGKMEMMGLGYEEMKKLNHGLIFAGISGYGASGPKSQRAGYDAIALAEAGLLHITGESDGGPTKPGVAIADLCTGLYTHGAILAAVNARHQNGGFGALIENSLFESSLSLLINVGLASLNLNVDQGPSRRRRGSRFGLGHPNLVPYGGYQTRDGRVLFIAANNNRQWKLFCEKMQLGEEILHRFGSNDTRVESRREIMEILGKRFREKDLKEWEEVFEGSGLPYGPINDVVEALEHPQADARTMTIQSQGIEAARDGLLRMIGPPVKFDGSQSIIRRNPPLLGEHTDEVLTELGHESDDIATLKKDGIV